MVRMGLVVVITRLLVYAGVIWIGLRLDADADVASWLLGGRVRAASGTWRTWLEHRWVFDEWLGHVSRTVRGAVVLILGISMSVVVRDGWRIVLLRSLTSCRLRLVVGLSCMLLRTLCRRWWNSSVGRLRAGDTFDIVMA